MEHLNSVSNRMVPMPDLDQKPILELISFGGTGPHPASSPHASDKASVPGATRRNWPALLEWKELADEMGYTCKRSPALKQRSDQTTKGVVVVLADANSFDTVVQGELARLLQMSMTLNGADGFSKLLVEASPDDKAELLAASRGWQPTDTCFGIDDPKFKKMHGASLSDACDAGLALLAAMSDDGSATALQELRGRVTALDRIYIRWLNADAKTKEATQEEFYAFYSALQRCVNEAHNEQRIAHLLSEIHAKSGPEHTTCVVLAASLVNTIKKELFAGKTEALVLARRSHLAIQGGDGSAPMWEGF